MTFVILSRRSLATSKARTISLDGFLALTALVLLTTLGLGLLAGRMLHPTAQTSTSTQAPEVQDAAPQPALVERIGELSARMVQLQIEASGLAERLDAVKEFEQRMQMNDTVPLGPTARTPPASAGGPLLKPARLAAEPVLGDAVQLVPGAASAAPKIIPAPASIDAQTLAHEPHAALTGIEHNMEQLAQLLASLDRHASDVSLAHMSFPGRAPVAKSIKTSGFGNRIDPFKRHLAFHSGMDFAGPSGSAVRASAGGKVIFVGVHKDYGKTVEIDHGAGLVTRYAHLSQFAVQKDQIVMPGQLIAKMGSTGRSTGSHLHFEILKDGHFVDPAIYLRHF